MPSTHLVDVAPERLAGWVERFTAAHGPVTWSVVCGGAGTDASGGGVGEDAAWEARAQDGSWTRLASWRPPTSTGAGGPAPGWERPPCLLVLLVRRGGYAVAVVGEDGSLVRHKVGTRHVQSRTAAGGWSQQRFARRRGHQADALVEAVAGHTGRLLGEAREPVAGLVLGGDRALAEAVLDALPTGRVAAVRRLPRRGLWDVADPRRSVLDDAVRRGRAVRVQVHNA